MAVLEYDFRIVGLAAVNRALSSLERRLQRFNAAQSRMMGGGTTAKRSTAATENRAIAKREAARRSLHKSLLLAEQRHQHKILQIQARGLQQQVNAEKRAAIQKRKAREREEAKAVRQRKAMIGRTMSRGAGNVMGAVRGVGALGAGALAVGGTVAFGEAIGVEKRLHGRAAALANQALGTQGGAGRDFQSLKNEALKVARVEGLRSGQGPEAVIDAMRQFQGISGRFDIGAKIAKYMTELADATDAGLEDVGRTAGFVFAGVMDQMPKGAKDAEKAMRQTAAIMDSMAAQSKVGSIEMRELATNMGALMSVTANFKGDIVDLTDQLGAMAQLAATGPATGVEEAMTALRNFTNDLVKKGSVMRGGLKKIGVDPFHYEQIGGEKVATKLRGPTEVVMDILAATKGDIRKIASIQGIRGLKAFQGFADIYTKAEEREKGTGLGAVRSRFEGFIGKGAAFGQARGQMAANRRAQADRQFEQAMAKFNDAIGQQLLPKLTQLVPKFVELIPSIVKATEGFLKLAEWLSKNPLTGLGVVIAGSFAKEIAAAGISALVKDRLINGLAGASTGLAGFTGKLAIAGVGLVGLAAAFDQWKLFQIESAQAGVDTFNQRANLMGIAEKRGEQHMIRKVSHADKVRATIESAERGEFNPVRSQPNYELLTRNEQGDVVATPLDPETQQLQKTIMPGGKEKFEVINQAATKQESAANKFLDFVGKFAGAVDKFSAAGLNRESTPTR